MQVYRARVLDAGGKEVEVAVKVVHPGLRQNLHRVSRTLLLRTIKLNLSYLFNQSFNLPSAVFFISALNSLFSGDPGLFILAALIQLLLWLQLLLMVQSYN